VLYDVVLTNGTKFRGDRTFGCRWREGWHDYHFIVKSSSIDGMEGKEIIVRASAVVYLLRVK